MSVMGIFRQLADAQGPLEDLEQKKAASWKAASYFLFRVLSTHHGVTVKLVELPTFPPGV